MDKSEDFELIIGNLQTGKAWTVSLQSIPPFNPYKYEFTPCLFLHLWN